jgi:CheY-like chemotaxis protein
MVTQMDSKTVLLVEDNGDNRIVYAAILQHHGFRVLEAANGEEGVRLARAERPDAILMDISLPVMDGWRATALLKGDPATSQIPIIALTAHALSMDRAKAKAVGCDGYLTKPCEPSRVVAALQRVIEASAVVAD